MESNYIFSKQRERERLYCISGTWPREVVGITQFCTNRKSAWIRKVTVLLAVVLHEHVMKTFSF